MNIRRIALEDEITLKKIYFNSIEKIEESIYTKEQKKAWSSQAWENKEFNKALRDGKGWLLEDDYGKYAFAIRYPKDRLSLLYCRGDSFRKGFGTILLKKIENDAFNEGINIIKTEASLLSYKLLLKNGWEIIRKEKIIIKDTFFSRYKMFKDLKQYLPN